MGRRKAVLIVLTGLLCAAGLFALRYSHAAAWRLPAADRPWVDRSVPAGAAAFGMAPDDYRRVTRPSLWRDSGRICVLLRSHYRDDGGSFVACYDERTGRPLSERAIGHALGPTYLSDPLWALIW